MVVSDWNGRYVGEDVEHGVAVGVEDVVAYGLVVVGEERHRRHGLDGILRRIENTLVKLSQSFRHYRHQQSKSSAIT